MEEEEREEEGGERGEEKKDGKGRKNSKDGAAILYSQVFLRIQDGVTFSFLSLAVVFLSGYVHSSSLSSDTSWSLSRGVLFLGYQRYTEVYRRTGFNCENLIIANCRFF